MELQVANFGVEDDEKTERPQVSVTEENFTNERKVLVEDS